MTNERRNVEAVSKKYFDTQKHRNGAEMCPVSDVCRMSKPFPDAQSAGVPSTLRHYPVLMPNPP